VVYVGLQGLEGASQRELPPQVAPLRRHGTDGPPRTRFLGARAAASPQRQQAAPASSLLPPGRERKLGAFLVRRERGSQERANGGRGGRSRAGEACGDGKADG